MQRDAQQQRQSRPPRPDGGSPRPDGGGPRGSSPGRPPRQYPQQQQQQQRRPGQGGGKPQQREEEPDIPVVRLGSANASTFFSSDRWGEVGASDEVVAALAALGITRPSHIQVGGVPG